VRFYHTVPTLVKPSRKLRGRGRPLPPPPGPDLSLQLEGYLPRLKLRHWGHLVLAPNNEPLRFHQEQLPSRNFLVLASITKICEATLTVDPPVFLESLQYLFLEPRHFHAHGSSCYRPIAPKRVYPKSLEQGRFGRSPRLQFLFWQVLLRCRHF